jgi:hypothetical protein
MRTINGMRVITDNNATTIRRTWRERLFTRPWEPRRKTKQVFYVIDPAAAGLGHEKMLVMSSGALDAIKRAEQ